MHNNNSNNSKWSQGLFVIIIQHCRCVCSLCPRPLSTCSKARTKPRGSSDLPSFQLATHLYKHDIRMHSLKFPAFQLSVLWLELAAGLYTKKLLDVQNSSKLEENLQPSLELLSSFTLLLLGWTAVDPVVDPLGWKSDAKRCLRNPPYHRKSSEKAGRVWRNIEIYAFVGSRPYTAVSAKEHTVPSLETFPPSTSGLVKASYM